MSNETKADRAYVALEPGWYVVNHETDRAVAGPFTEPLAAHNEKDRRNARWPDDSDVLRVRTVSGGPS